MSLTITQRLIEGSSRIPIPKKSSEKSIGNTGVISTTSFILMPHLSSSLSVYFRATGQSSYIQLPTQSHTPSIPSATHVDSKTFIIIGTISVTTSTGVVFLAILCIWRRRKGRSARAGNWIEMNMNGQSHYRRLLDKDNLNLDFDDDGDDTTL